MEGEVSNNCTSNPGVWQIFIYVTADFTMKKSHSSIFLEHIAVQVFICLKAVDISSGSGT